jgi:hypothetical protein
MLGWLIGFSALAQAEVRVDTVAELRNAVRQAKPGTTILIEAGEYSGRLFFENVHGASGRSITIRGADAANPPKFVDGGIQISKASNLKIQHLSIERAQGNGLNIDDGADSSKPSHSIEIESVHVSKTPAGNNDGIKLSGLADFSVSNCTVQQWGGSGIDMVGCRDGRIVRCAFRNGGDNGIQTKGGTSNIRIEACTFDEAGQRGVNAGGSTGMAFFRPPVASMPANGRYEARNISITDCRFAGGTAAVAFVGLDGGLFSKNRILDPKRWAFRILQETRSEGFVPCRNVRIEANQITFLSNQWFEGGINIGPGTEPQSFKFIKNRWLCSDRPELSKPRLPVQEIDGVYGKPDPF